MSCTVNCDEYKTTGYGSGAKDCTEIKISAEDIVFGWNSLLILANKFSSEDLGSEAGRLQIILIYLAQNKKFMNAHAPVRQSLFQTLANDTLYTDDQIGSFTDGLFNLTNNKAIRRFLSNRRNLGLDSGLNFTLHEKPVKPLTRRISRGGTRPAGVPSARAANPQSGYERFFS